MMVSQQPEIVTLIANPPPATDNGALDLVHGRLTGKNQLTHAIYRVASMYDIDAALGEVFAPPFKGTIRLQIIGHSIPGSMCLGATWTENGLHEQAATAWPFLLLDTNPTALGLIAKWHDKMSEVMLVGCHIGSSTSFGHAINGRTLTYTLAELLRCKVLGADDDVGPDEYDGQGWYMPAPTRRRPKGWRWNDAAPPSWTDPGLDPLPRNRKVVGEAFEIRAIRSAMLPMVSSQQAVELPTPVRVTCQYATLDKPEAALPELSVETDHGPAQILCGGRILLQAGACYVLDRNPQLAMSFAAMLRTADAARNPAAPLAS